MIAAIYAMLIVLILPTSGCISSTPRVVPEDESAREVLRGRDCVVRVFAIGSTTASVERAKLSGHPINNQNGPSSSILRIHHIEFTEDDFLFAHHHCVDVVGE